MTKGKEVKSLLMKVKESEKAGLKLNILSHHFMANRWRKIENNERLKPLAPKSLWIMIVAMELKDACSLEEKQ